MARFAALSVEAAVHLFRRMFGVLTLQTQGEWGTLPYCFWQGSCWTCPKVNNSRIGEQMEDESFDTTAETWFVQGLISPFFSDAFT